MPLPDGVRPSTTYRTLFRRGPFRRLFVAETVSSVGDALSRVGIPILVFELTGSPLALGTSFAVLQLPWVLVSGTAGAFADRHHRITLMVWSAAVESAALVVILSAQSEWALFGGLLVTSVMQVLRTTAVQAALPEISGDDLLAKASAARVVMVQATNVGGLLLGGLIVALIGSRGAIAVDAMTFLAYGILVFPLRSAIRHPHRAGAAARSEPRQGRIGEGVRFIWTSPPLRFLALFMAFRGMAFIGIMPLLVVYVEQELGAPASMLAIFLVMASVGVTLGSVVAGSARTSQASSSFLLLGSAAAGLLLMAMSATNQIVWATLIFFLCMTAYSTGNLVTNVRIPQLAPSAIRGRVIGLSWSIIKGGQVVGAVLLGTLASEVSMEVVLTVAGLALLFTAGIAKHVTRPATLNEIDSLAGEAA